jgi:hypothetical protein
MKSCNLSENIRIDFQLAQSVLDRLGYILQDLSLDYGDVVIPSGDISHQLYYKSAYSDCNLIGYVWIENGLYHTAVLDAGNFLFPEAAALSLLPHDLVEKTVKEIEWDSENSFQYM